MDLKGERGNGIPARSVARKQGSWKISEIPESAFIALLFWVGEGMAVFRGVVGGMR